MTRWRLAGAAAIAVGLLAPRADADNPPGAAIDVGRSIFIANDVDGQAGDAPPRRIAVNDDIVFQEDITTGDAAKAVIEFRDGSTFEIGPNAVVRIDAFVFNPEESTSHKALSVTRGVFRYVSGYVAGDQDTQVKTPGGSMAIRGSVAAGIVDPAVPDFLYLGEGSATFTNTAGSSALQPGNAIAVPSTTAAPMAPDAMPAPVAAQALQVIERRLPPRAALANRPAADEAWLRRAGAADLVPAAEQQRLAAPTGPRPPPAGRGSGSLAAELGLLVEANRVNLFERAQATRTPEQNAFLARAARERPDAAGTLRRFTDQARAMHAGNVTRGTEFVIRGVGHAAPSAQVMRRVTDAAAPRQPVRRRADQPARHRILSRRRSRGAQPRARAERGAAGRAAARSAPTERLRAPPVRRPTRAAGQPATPAVRRSAAPPTGRREHPSAAPATPAKRSAAAATKAATRTTRQETRRAAAALIRTPGGGSAPAESGTTPRSAAAPGARRSPGKARGHRDPRWPRRRPGSSHGRRRR